MPPADGMLPLGSRRAFPICKDSCAKIEDEQIHMNKSGYFSPSGDSRVLVNC